MAIGIIDSFDDEKGFGFISSDDGEENIYAHFSEIKVSIFLGIEEGQPVSFDVKIGPNGKEAVNIIPID